MTRACRAYAAARQVLLAESAARGLCLEPAELDAMAAILVDRMLPALCPELVGGAAAGRGSHGSRRTGGLL